MTNAAASISTRSHHALVQMAAASVRDGIAAAEIVRSLGVAMIDAIDTPAQLALSGPPLADSGRRSWWQRVRGRLRGAVDGGA